MDGAHIRTLVLTFLFREMPDLIEAGYVYIAKAPLYKVKSGEQEVYIEKESELEEFLLRDKLEKMEISDRAGTQLKLTHDALAEVRAACSSSTRAGRRACAPTTGHEIVDFLEESHDPRRRARPTCDAVIALMRATTPRASRTRPS